MPTEKCTTFPQLFNGVIHILSGYLRFRLGNGVFGLEGIEGENLACARSSDSPPVPLSSRGFYSPEWRMKQRAKRGNFDNGFCPIVNSDTNLFKSSRSFRIRLRRFEERGTGGESANHNPSTILPSLPSISSPNISKGTSSFTTSRTPLFSMISL